MLIGDIVDLSDKSKWLEKVYSARNNQELAKGYDEWAEDYDQDALEKGEKWQLHEKTDSFQALPLIDSKLFNRVFVYRVS
jgi:hypothetical protein